jgi:hypothetical protein
MLAIETSIRTFTGLRPLTDASLPRPLKASSTTVSWHCGLSPTAPHTPAYGEEGNNCAPVAAFTSPDAQTLRDLTLLVLGVMLSIAAALLTEIISGRTQA